MSLRSATLLYNSAKALRAYQPVAVTCKRYLSDTSFARGIFMGELREDELFPYPDVLSEEQKETVSMMMEAGHAFFQETNDAAANDANEAIPEDQLDQMRALGMYGLMVPEEYGGIALTNTMYAKFGELSGEYDLGIGIHTGAHQSIGYKGILLEGTEEQKAKYLPSLASGEVFACFCLTEPSSGSDASSIKTRAVLNETGTHYVLNGSKIWISNGGIAEIFTVFAQTPVVDAKTGETKDKMTAFIVERSFGGVSHGPPEKKMGIKCSNTAEVYFENCEVPVENVLGEIGGGFKVAMKILNNGRFGMGACLTGTMRMLITRAIDHANNRKQFVSNLREYQGIQQKIARMNLLCYANESMAYMLCGNMDKGAPEYQLEAAISKIFASQSAWDVCDETIQILGGAGFMKDVGIERWMRDLRIFRIFEGTNDILKLFIALNGVQDIGKKLKSAGTVGAMMGLMKSKFLPAAPLKTKVHSDLAPSVDMLRGDIAKFSVSVSEQVIKHKKKIIEQQVLLNRIADVAILLQSMGAVISRSNTAADKGDTSEITLANAWCADSHRRISVLLEEMASSDVSKIDLAILEVGRKALDANGYLAKSPVGV